MSLLSYLVAGEIEKFAAAISKLLLAVASFRDYAKQPEAFYHGFMLALTASLLDDYYIASNRESGQGYPDLLFIPKESNRENADAKHPRQSMQPLTRAVILEFKHVKDNEDSKQIAQAALDQIDIKQYDTMIQQHQYVTEIIKVGLAFDGKLVNHAYAMQNLNLIIK